MRRLYSKPDYARPADNLLFAASKNRRGNDPRRSFQQRSLLYTCGVRVRTIAGHHRGLMASSSCTQKTRTSTGQQTVSEFEKSETGSSNKCSVNNYHLERFINVLLRIKLLTTTERFFRRWKNTCHVSFRRAYFRWINLHDNSTINAKRSF